MIIRVLKNSTEVISREEIDYQKETRCIYNKPHSLVVGTVTDFTLEREQEYTLEFADQQTKNYTLNRLYVIYIDTVKLFCHEFLEKSIYLLVNNRVSNDAELFSVPFKKYNTERVNQLEYLIFELRKKAAVLIINEDTGILEQSHIRRLITNRNAQDIDSNDGESVIYDVSAEIVKNNYYTILPDNEYIRTKNGYGFPKFIPFATRTEIDGLDTFLSPKYNLKTGINTLRVGGKVKVLQKEYVIIESEMVGFKEVFAGSFILGEIR